MICPRCGQKTTRLVYRSADKFCPDCANPNFIHAVSTLMPPAFEYYGRIGEFFAGKQPDTAPFKCVIVPNLTDDVVVIPAGTQIIESFSQAQDGKITINETYVAEFGVFKGALPK